MRVSGEEFDAISAYTVGHYEKAFPSLAGMISLELMKQRHAQAVRSWLDVSSEKDGYGNWDWLDILNRRKKNQFMNYVIACNGSIEGMVSCRIDMSSKDIAIEFIQRKGGSPILKGRIIPLAVLQCAVIGYTLELETVSVKNPAPGVVSYYQTHLPRFQIETDEKTQAVTRLYSAISGLVP